MSPSLKGRRVRIVKGLTTVSGGRLGDVLEQYDDGDVLVQIINQPGWSPQKIPISHVDVLDDLELEYIKSKAYIKRSLLCVQCGVDTNTNIGYVISIRRPPKRGCNEHRDSLNLNIVLCEACNTKMRSIFGMEGDRLANTLVQMGILRG